MLGSQQQAVVLLIFGAPYLQYRERLVAQLHRTHVHLAAAGVHDLLHHVAVAARALVVQRHNGVGVAHLHARTHHAPQLLAHLRIAALHRVEVELGLVGAGGEGGGGATAHTNAVGWATDLADEHARRRWLLLKVSVVDLPHTRTKHDWLQPLATLTARQPLPKRARVAQHQRLAKLVAVVAGAVGGVDEDLLGGGEGVRVGEGGILAWDGPLGEVEVAGAVASGADTHDGADTRGVGVAHSATRASLRARVGRHRAGKVVRLRGEQEVKVAGDGADGGRGAGHGRTDDGNGSTADGRAVVVETDDAVGRVGCQRLFHHLEQTRRHLLPVNDQLGAEEPVPAVLAVALPDVKQLHSGGVALEVVTKEAQVVLEVLLVKREPHLRIDRLQRSPPLSQHGDRLHGRRDRIYLEARQWLAVNLLRHAVMHQGGKGGGLFGGDGGGAVEEEATGDLHAADLV
mmetsp:Transcript_33625/g.60142  ORF Transcript_33625/g.60142 Transcript_33625/m.60142 type:complete len:458 (+) Transcript_33625:446-1819(+)